MTKYWKLSVNFQALLEKIKGWWTFFYYVLETITSGKTKHTMSGIPLKNSTKTIQSNFVPHFGKGFISLVFLKGTLETGEILYIPHGHQKS